MESSGVSATGRPEEVEAVSQVIRWATCWQVLGAVAMLALGAQIRVPLPGTPVPMTLQSLAVLFVGLTLAPGSASLATLIYLMCGAAGLPVFAAGSAGILGPTGGYLVGFLPAVLAAGWVRGSGPAGFGRLLAAAMAACVVLFSCGVGWQTALFGGDWRLALATGLLPFASKAVVQVFLVAGVVSKVGSRRQAG